MRGVAKVHNIYPCLWLDSSFTGHWRLQIFFCMLLLLMALEVPESGGQVSTETAGVARHSVRLLQSSTKHRAGYAITRLGLYRISGLLLYPVTGRISGFNCRISGWPYNRIGKLFKINNSFDK